MGASPQSGGIAALNPRLNTDDALSGNDFAPRGSVGEPPDNVTNFGAGAINPRKGDSSCYPRVMPKAYPWIKLISPWFNPGMGCIAA